MKIETFSPNPFTTVKVTGGSTFEPTVGWWAQVGDESQIHLGMPFVSKRDAIYIPTIQKTGEAVDEGMVTYLKSRATELGLTTFTQAAGMWVLSVTQEVQTETVWIAYADHSVKSEALSELAMVIKNAANQDAVAWEENGELRFTDFILDTVRRDATEVSKKENPTRVWVVPVSDLETVEIINLLQGAGEHVFLTGQKWGAQFAKLESGITETIEKYRAENSAIQIIGVKVNGQSPEGWNTETIQPYSGKGTCPIEAVAEKIGVELNQYQKLVAVNLKGWIPGLEAQNTPKGVIEAIRQSDRCAQGVTPDHEAGAVRGWKNRKIIGDLVVVNVKESKCSPFTDRFYGQYQNLLVVGEDKEVNFFGRAELCSALKEKFPNAPAPWGGSADSWLMLNNKFSFWGGYSSSEEVEKFILEFLG